MATTRRVPELWLPESARGWVKRVILHWTAGTYNASDEDRKHYHILVEGDGVITRGNTPIGVAAAHTRFLNTGSVGISLCGMLGAVEGKSYGSYPIQRVQVERATEAAAEVLFDCGLKVSEKTLLCHSEVWRVYRRPQRGKWDIDCLKHEPGLDANAVHELLRRKADWYLGRLRSNGS